MRAPVSLLASGCWLAHALLAVGLCGPCMTVTPRMEPHTGLARWLGLLDGPRTYSVLGGIGDLVRHGNAAIGAVLLVFSVLFPIAKLVAVRAALSDVRRGLPRRRGGFAAHLGKFSMVDVFVIALIILASRSWPGGTEVELRYGAWAFASAALLPIPIALKLQRAVHR